MLKNYAFLTDKDLQAIEESMGIIKGKKELTRGKGISGIHFFKAESYLTLFEEYAQQISQAYKLNGSDKLYISQLSICGHLPVEKDNSPKWNEAYLIKSDLDIFSIYIIGYWKVLSLHEEEYQFTSFKRI